MNNTCKRCHGEVLTERTFTVPNGLGGFITITKWIEPQCENCFKIPIEAVSFEDARNMKRVSAEEGKANDARVQAEAPWLFEFIKK